MSFLSGAGPTKTRGRGGELSTYHSHGFSQHEDQGLVGQGLGAGEEEEGQGDVEEGEGGEDGLGGYESHGG